VAVEAACVSGLLPHLLRRIRQTGPLSIADYMTECLTHPAQGYYTTREPFGTSGDFVTAPEISQMFGELLGLCLAQGWLDLGAPAPFALVELGPGRGTLMADLLRATRGVPGFHEGLELHLVEVSPALRARQAEALAGWRPVWHDRVAEVPALPLLVVANEFFDALPVRQFLRRGNGWAERIVGAKGDRLVFGLTAPAPLAALAHRLEDTEEGDLVEVSAAGEAVAAEIGGRIARDGGAALIVDYGGWRSRGDTFQALRAHRKVDPLDEPGTADLTTHVDFEALARAGRGAGAAATAMTTQGVFLERLGITARAQALARGSQADAVAAAHRRLTHPGEMGDLFKVIAFHRDDRPPLPGLDP
jgi:NADH dehydrogenase [ubiquinone] 1 alpha subcomplex assembly factor 7